MYRSPFKAGSKETCSFRKKGSWAAGYHTGVDRVSSNTTLVSPADGTVQRNEYNASYGNMVIITTADGKSILMAHMKDKSKLKVGASVKRGDAVGTMGNTGNSFGVHLHIEVQNSKTWAYNKNLLAPNSYIDWNDTTSKGIETIPFKKGDVVTLTTNVNVRTGAGTSYKQKTVSQLTKDGKKNATSKLPLAKATLKSGTRVTIQTIKLVGSDIWAQIPSGWICLRYGGKNYVK
ncbi:MAG: M23 family metallopeptidase [Eubacterium sp.]|nr:M23 family metallopeptidase [Eubacterium sp.]